MKLGYRFADFVNEISKAEGPLPFAGNVYCIC